jgi:hypothetical protein
VRPLLPTADGQRTPWPLPRPLLLLRLLLLLLRLLLLLLRLLLLLLRLLLLLLRLLLLLLLDFTMLAPFVATR